MHSTAEVPGYFILKMITIACAAVIGQQNQPIWLQPYQQPSSSEDAHLHYSYIVHCSLDAVDEKINAPNRTPGESADPFLGLLYPTEDYKVYGFITNTKVKLVLVVDNGSTPRDEGLLRQIFRRFHAAYVDVVSNPFHDIGEPITSAAFSGTIKAIVDSCLVRDA